MNDKRLQAQLREDIGTGMAKKIRKENMVPGIVYSRGEETRHLTVDQLEFIKVFRKVGTSSLMELDFNGEVVPAIVKTVQRDPVKGQVIHIDFQKLDMKEKIKLTVPLTLLHKDSIELQPSVLMQMLDSIEIECLPGDIPEEIAIDVSKMTYDTPLYVKDLHIVSVENVNVITDLESIICTLNEPTMSEEDEDEEAEEVLDPAEVPVVGEETEE